MVIIIFLQAAGIFLGFFIGAGAIIMITTPVFIPIVIALGFDPYWFGIIYILNMEMAGISPPYGLNLFVMKSVAGPDVSITEVYKAAYPFVGIQLFEMIILLAFPIIVLWLPNLMKG